MSTTTSATMESRSSSPKTPETSDVPHTVTIRGELPSWYIWDGDPFRTPDDERMLQLDDIIQEHVYDDSACSGVENSPPNNHAPPELASLEPLRTSLRRSIHESGLSIPPLSQMHSISIVPPPAARTCKRDPASIPRRVVYPPRESCYNLAILTPNIPENGTKSRVETQVRVTVDLAHASTSAGEQNQYGRVGSWKWLKLPPGTSTKRRTRREGKIDPAPLDILHLTATVTCASAPHNPVISCGSCRNREAKRVARKLAARVRPARSDSDTPEDGRERPRSIKEDTTSIIQFNCPDVLDFSAGSAVLPVRITCYCRHHREKVGFNIHFAMMDHNGRLVGTGMTPPIMITDDHKSTVKSGTVPSTPVVETQVDWSSLPPAASPTDNTSLLKHPSRNGRGQPKTRSNFMTWEASVTSLSSAITSPSTRPSIGPNTRPPTPLQLPQSSSPVSVHQPSVAFVTDTNSPSTFNSSEPISASFPNSVPGTAVFGPPNDISTVTTPQFSSPCDMFSPNTSPVTQPSQLLVPPRPMPFLFFNPSSPPSVTSLPLPKIHCLIPSSGPTHSGIEVTVLGENFHPAIQLNCVFGDVVASSTQRWSDNTLLCVLPPQSAPGVVAVWFEGLDEIKNSTLPSLFTYTDESDRVLMELALQVDAKNIALRIVGSTDTEDSPSGSNSAADDIMQVASSSFHDIRPLLHDYEAAVIKFLSLVDVPIEKHSGMPPTVAMSHCTSSGQTLLHLAVFLKFTSLTEFLIAHGVDLDARDRNRCTALHFAILVQSKECTRLLVVAGADLEIVNALGKTPQDTAPSDFFEGIIDHVTLSQASVEDEEDGESHLGDVESDADATTAMVKRRHASRGIRHRPRRPHDSHEQLNKESSQVSHTPHTPDKVENIATQKLEHTDEKQAASFVAMIQRMLAQIPGPQGIIPTIPQLPLLHLPEMPTVPWAVLPQIPMVFPVLVPMPGWPSFLSDKRDSACDEVPSSKEGDSRPTRYSTTQELRATWEKWIAVAIVTAMLRPPPTDEAPPIYTPRETEETMTQQRPATQTTECVSYKVTPVPALDADAYKYKPVMGLTDAVVGSSVANRWQLLPDHSPS
ncbi:hypothetical protein L210DRAFT_3710267 [Boletus edulis BED1]|uniref:IPT/TIG domain-containing protein n=1 Tax=Boletus edulis BED1 TaxID=1328754 RepID=A0AAD4BK45_BOLED|nr:hypothetical protein L210DRAFT_3710267 [Boletus edulis BED1]